VARNPARQAIYEELLQLEEALQRLENAHEANPIAHYIPNPNQEPFHYSRASGRVCTGSNRSGKTAGEITEAISCALGYRPWLEETDPRRIVYLGSGRPMPVPNVGRMFAHEMKNIEEVLVPEFKRWAPLGTYKIKKGYRGYPERIDMDNGSVIYLRAYKQDTEVQEGTKGHWVSFDEPPPYDLFISARRGLMDYHGIFWMALTPLSEPWIWDILLPQCGPGKRLEHFQYSIYNNGPPFGPMTKEAIDEFIADLDPAEFEARILGNPKYLVGRVFSEWRPEPPFYVKPGRIPPFWQRYCMVDPHPRKPVAVLWIATDPEGEYAVAYDELFDKKLITIEDVAHAILQKEARHRELYGEYSERTSVKITGRIIDDSAEEMERGTGASILKMFAGHGLNFTKAFKRNKWAGYNQIHGALKVSPRTEIPSLQVTTDCPTLAANFLKHVWDDWRNSQGAYKDTKQDVVTRDDDMIACLRYFYQRHGDRTGAVSAPMEALSRKPWRVNLRREQVRAGMWTGV